MMIWGSRTRHLAISHGEFYCPHCRGRCLYLHKRAPRSFTLYFTPWFELRRLGDYVECQSCRYAYQMEVLTFHPIWTVGPALATVGHSWLYSQLTNGVALQVIQRRLVQRGYTPAVAEQMVSRAAGAAVIDCPQCNYTYRKGMTHCTKCGTRLATADHPHQTVSQDWSSLIKTITALEEWLQAPPVPTAPETETQSAPPTWVNDLLPKLIGYTLLWLLFAWAMNSG